MPQTCDSAGGGAGSVAIWSIVRRYGWIPIGATPARTATSSAHAPAASTRMSASWAPPRVAIRQCPSYVADSSAAPAASTAPWRSEEHTSELQSLMRISYAVFCLKKKKKQRSTQNEQQQPQHKSQR